MISINSWQKCVLGLLLCCAVQLPHSGAAATAHSPEALKSSIDLGASTFNTTLLALPLDAHVLMEFYASWCPHCRHFKPHYDKVAAHCERHKASGQRVWVYRVDCAVEIKLCRQYQVNTYPTLYLGAASDMVAANVTAFHKFDYRKFKMDAKGTLAWILQALDAEWQQMATEDGTPMQPQQPHQPEDAVLPPAIAQDMKWTMSDVEEATLQLLEQVSTTPALQQGNDNRAALAAMLRLWGAAHPSDRCRRGSQTAALRLPVLWPEGADSPSDDLQGLHVCGRAHRGGSGSSRSSRRGWGACKGSVPGARGFTCGLWLLFHTTAARVSEADGGQLFMDALRQWAQQLFMCRECSQHFQGVLARPEAAAVHSRRDAMLWLWRTHNEINARLAKEEAAEGHSTSGDPAHPKRQWPSETVCPLCRLPRLPEAGEGPSSDAGGGGGSSSISGGSADDSSIPGGWNEEEVVRFLQRYYGDTGASRSGQDSSVLSGGQGGVSRHFGQVRFGKGGMQALRLTSSKGISSDSAAGGSGSSSARFSLAALLMLAVVVYYCYSRAVRRPSRSGYLPSSRLPNRLL